MAQSIESWEHHIPTLCREREVLVYECRGQGPYPPPSFSLLDDTDDDPYRNVTLPYHADGFERVVSRTFPHSQKVDVAGFSFGGRVALASALLHPGRIRRLHLSGVGAHRDRYAEVVLDSWRDILGRNGGDQTFRLKSFGWSILLATYSDSFLAERGADVVSDWVERIERLNTVEGLRALMEQAQESGGEWDVLPMAERLAASGGVVPRERLVVGSHDRLATVEAVRKLNDVLGWGDDAVGVFKGCGHAVIMEEARLWREDLLSFLDHS